MFDLVRREIEYTLGGSQAVSASPTQISADTTGARVVQGTLDALGPNGDPVTYTVTAAPANGTVQVNADGTYLYTPDTAVAATGGTDNFTVQVTDAAVHLANLFGAPAHGITVPVSVTVPQATVQSGLPPATKFYLYNLTQHPVEILGYDAQTKTVSGDVYFAPGTTIAAGGSLPFQVNLASKEGDKEGFTFDAASLDTAESTTWTVSFIHYVNTYGETISQSGCSTHSSNGSSCAPSSDGSYYNTTTASLLDPPGTTITIPGSDSQEQSAVLEALCGSGQASCTFAVRTQAQAVGNPHTPTLFSPVINNTSLEQSTDYTVTDTASIQTSYSVSNKVTVKLEGIVQASVTATYGTTLTNTATYTYHLNLPIPAYTEGVLTATTPVIRYTGEFTVKAGNTTYNLPNAIIDDPDPTPRNDPALAGGFVFTTPEYTPTSSPSGSTTSAAGAGPLPPANPAAGQGTPIAATSASAYAPLQGLPALLDGVRREILYTFGGSRAVALAPTQVTASPYGTRPVSGTMNAVGPNGDPLTYTVAQQPADGTVQINADGTFTYTPNSDFSTAGGTDDFQVTATDAAIHLANLFGLPASATRTPVTVTVPAASQSPQPNSGYDIHNLTQQTIYSQIPAKPTAIQPGESINLASGSGSITFSTQAPYDHSLGGEQWTVNLDNGTCTTGYCSGLSLLDNPQTFGFYDQSTQPADVTTLLNNLCGTGQATCVFAAEGFESTLGNRHIADGTQPFTNSSTGDLPSEDFTLTQTVTPTTNYSVSATVKLTLSPIVTDAITTTYGAILSDSTTYTQKVSLKLPANAQTTIYYEDPVVRYNGTWVVSFGNTVVQLYDVYADYPDSLGNGVYLLDEVPLS